MSFINIPKKKKKLKPRYIWVWNQNETPSIVLCRDCFASFRFLGLCVCPERIWDWGLQEWRRPALDDPWCAAVHYFFSFPRDLSCSPPSQTCRQNPRNVWLPPQPPNYLKMMLLLLAFPTYSLTVSHNLALRFFFLFFLLLKKNEAHWLDYI